MRLVQEQEKQSFQELAVQEGLLKELTQNSRWSDRSWS
jgi:hypothetical protein